MGLEWLESVVQILTEAGIRADAEYPPETVREVTEPVAAVGLTGLDYSAGEVRFLVQVLSPRILGGWTCQTGAVDATAVLEAAGLRCQMGRMAYLSGCDCFCVEIQAVMAVGQSDDEGSESSSWQILLGELEVEWVTEFTASQDQGRRLIGSVCQADPVGVTNGSGGWSIQLVQQLPSDAQEQEGPEEPFTLTLRQGNRDQIYRGCCWNRVERVHSQSGIKIQRQGFALSREVSENE